MARIEEAIYALLNVTGVTSLVPASAITPDTRRKGGTLPAIVYQIGYSEPIKVMTGAHGGLTRTDVIVAAYALTRLQCRDVMNACGVALDGYAGETGGVRVRGITLDSLNTSYVEPGAGENQGVYVATLTVRIMHSTF
jgi:hypothetical protein